MENPENKTRLAALKEKFIEPLAVVGVIGIVVFAIWITFAGITSIPAVGEFISGTVWPRMNSALVSFTSLFVPAEKIEVSLSPDQIETGSPVTLTWEHDTSRDGIYVFYYPCMDDISFVTAEKITVECDKELDIKGQKSIVITPILTNTTAISMPVQISFRGTGDEVITGNSTLTVNPKPSTVAVKPSPSPVASPKSTPKPSPTPVVSTNTSKPTVSPTPTAGPTTQKTYTATAPGSTIVKNIQADLAVRVLAVGAIDPSTNVFTAKDTVKGTDRVAVKFEIINLGTKKAEGWSFNAVLPTYPSNIFNSESQQSLAPGDKIEYTLGFDQLDTTLTDATIVIYADPTSSINEPNKENNLGKISVKVTK